MVPAPWNRFNLISRGKEGDERDTDKDSIRFFYIAKGSLAELRTQMEIAHRIGYIEKTEFLNIEEKAIEIGKMLGALIKARKHL